MSVNPSISSKSPLPWSVDLTLFPMNLPKLPRHRILTASIASLVALSATASAQTWDGETDTNWNTPTNWDTDTVPAGGNAFINTNTGNIATIFEDFASIPVDIFV